MDERTYVTVDKTGWGDGPWRGEPDKVLWVDEATGLDCMVKRNPGGALCGYVGVGPDHPLHGVEYERPDVSVHGGLTYSDACWGDEATGICHTPEPGRHHDVWWFGFDCAHAFDLTPGYTARGLEPIPGETYRDLAYVRREVESLARQLAADTKAAAS
jgi:hypothetical protein